MPLTFITGPVRSGKSSFALKLARASELPVTFFATANVYDGDPEWRLRLERHRTERPAEWNTVESAGMDNDEAIAFVGGLEAGRLLLVDAMGTYLASRIDEHLAIAGDPPSLETAIERDTARFVDALIACRAEAIVVGEQVGWDVVPERPGARIFRDVLGRQQRRLALAAAGAYLVVAGFAIDLRRAGVPVEDS